MDFIDITEKYNRLKQKYKKLKLDFDKKELEDTELILKFDKKMYDLKDEIEKLKYENKTLQAKLLYVETELEDAKKNK